MLDAAEIASRLGGTALSGGFLCRCPVRAHGKGRGDVNPSLFIKDGHTSVVFACFSGCSSGEIIDALKARGLWPQQKRSGRLRYRSPPKRRANSTRTSIRHFATVVHRPDARALELWNQGAPIDGTLAERFLQCRGIILSAPPAALRFIDCVEYGDGTSLPAMLASVTAPGGEAIAIQVTFLSADGSRKADVPIPRKTIGALGAGAIRFALAGNQLGIAEGTEKALAAIQLHNIPCWSSLSAGRMHNVWIPGYVEDLFIFADNDDAGRSAAEATSNQHRHRRVILRYPPARFKDWDEVAAALAQAGKGQP